MSRSKKPRKPMPPGREATRSRPAKAVSLADPTAGRGAVQASLGGTALLALTSLAGAIDPSALAAPALIVSLVMFFGGTLIFAWSFLIAVGRSRESEIALAGVYGLSESAPSSVRVRLFSSAVAQVLIAIAAAAAQPDSSLVFDFLAVMWGLGLIGLWGARYGAFPPKPDDPRLRAARGR